MRVVADIAGRIGGQPARGPPDQCQVEVDLAAPVARSQVLQGETRHLGLDVAARGRFDPLPEAALDFAFAWEYSLLLGSVMLGPAAGRAIPVFFRVAGIHSEGRAAHQTCPSTLEFA